MRRIDRFDNYMVSKGLNDNKVTERLNLSVGLLGKSRKEGSDLSLKTIEKILNFYTDLNRVWLLTGEGDMLTGDKPTAPTPKPSNQGYTLVPLVPISAQAGRLNNFVTSVRESECEKIISPISGADMAIRISGDSMSPEYPNGAQIFIKKINEKSFIDWGRVYVLDTINGTVVKILVPSDREGYIKCKSINPDPIYAPFDIALSDIYGIYRVLLCMSIK